MNSFLKTLPSKSLTILLGGACLAASTLAYAQSNISSSHQPESQPRWHADHVTHLFGLSAVPPKSVGELTITDEGMSFSSKAGEATLPHAQVLRVSIGSQRRETGGTAGRLTRKFILPPGFGAVTQTQVDLLTIEFRDANHAYHGAVFLLPKSKAAEVAKIFAASASSASDDLPPAPCSDNSRRPTMVVNPIVSGNVPVPAEYRVLLYEQLVFRLEQDAGFGHIFRDGDQSPIAQCPAAHLTITVNAFTKGNAVLRSSTGPLGNFVGATKFKFHAVAKDYVGKVLLEKDFSFSQRGDSDDLDIADKIAKSITKHLKKTGAHKNLE